MKRLIYILMVAIGSIFLTTTATAGDVDDVKAAVQAFYEALNSSTVDDFTKFILPAGSGNFPRTGELLDPGAITVEDIKNTMQANFDAGLKFELQIHHLDAKVYGNAAVATYYTTGPTTYPNGTVLQGTFRGSLMWIKQSGQWKIAHVHISSLQAEPQ